MISERVRAEQKRLRRVALDAGLDDVELWYEAQHMADLSDRPDRTALVCMRELLTAAGVEHRAPDLFGTQEWRCEECRAPWDGRPQCQRCGNRTRVSA